MTPPPDETPKASNASKPAESGRSGGGVNPEPLDPIWERLSRALFGVRRTSDEGLFTYRVMREIRQLQPVWGDIAWHRFLRLALPALGVGVASLVLATRTPAFSASLWMDTALFHQQTPDEDPLSGALEDFR